MEAIGSRHAACVKRLNRLFGRLVTDRALVQVHNPVRLDDFSEPEPDVALVRPRADDYAEGHPGPDDTYLIVEVADTTVELDRDVKARLYATAGIPEYWVVDLPVERIDVRRTPEEDGYLEVSGHERGEVLHPATFPDIAVPVSEVLPP